MFSVTRPYVGFLYTDLKRLIQYDKGVQSGLNIPISWHQSQELLC